MIAVRCVVEGWCCADCAHPFLVDSFFFPVKVENSFYLLQLEIGQIVLTRSTDLTSGFNYLQSHVQALLHRLMQISVDYLVCLLPTKGEPSILGWYFLVPGKFKLAVDNTVETDRIIVCCIYRKYIACIFFESANTSQKKTDNQCNIANSSMKEWFLRLFNQDQKQQDLGHLFHHIHFLLFLLVLLVYIFLRITSWCYTH